MSERLAFKSAGAVPPQFRNRTKPQDAPSFCSTTAEKFAPGNFVTTWNPELGRNAVGVTRAIEQPQEANPRVLVKWLHDLSQEWVRSEYLYLAD